MRKRSAGLAAVVGGGIAVALGVVTLVVAFMASSLALTYVSVALSVLAPVLFTVGIALIVTGAD